MALPRPITGAEEYLAALHDRMGENNDLLRQVLGRLPDPAPAREPGETVELREPASPAAADVAEPARPAAPEQTPEPAAPSEGPAAAPTPKRPARKRPAAKTATTKES